MPAYRPAGITQLETFYGLSGQILAGGYLKFYEAGTTTPQDVYGDEDLSVNNGDEIALDASGRPFADIWADTDAAYFIELYDEDDVKQGEIDNVEAPGGSALSIPIPEAGEFLTGDGAQFLTATVREVPDPSGHSNEFLQTDGTSVFWAVGPEDPEPPEDPEIEVGSNRFQGGTSGDETKFLHQWGNGTAPASGNHRTTATVTFPVAYSATPEVFPVIKASSICSAGLIGSISVTSVTTTGCTVNIDVNDDDTRSQFNITSSVAFGWHSVGNIEVSE